MKKGVLNYSMTWSQSGENHEEIYFRKLDLIAAYTQMLTQDNLIGKISALRLLEIPRADKPAKDITGSVNRFLQ